MSRAEAAGARPTSRPPAQIFAAQIFAALGDGTRLALLDRLEGGRTLSVSELRDGLALTRQGVSKHLKVLEEAGVVSHERVGRESRYALEPAALLEARAYLDRVAAQWDAALGRLARHIEENPD